MELESRRFIRSVRMIARVAPKARNCFSSLSLCSKHNIVSRIYTGKRQFYCDRNHGSYRYRQCEPKRIFHISFGRYMAIPYRNGDRDHDGERRGCAVIDHRTEGIKSQKERTNDPEKMQDWNADNKPSRNQDIGSANSRREECCSS